MSVKLEKAYRKELHKALEKCQFIEETLRMCIFSAVEIARLQLSPHFPIKYKTEDINWFSISCDEAKAYSCK